MKTTVGHLGKRQIFATLGALAVTLVSGWAISAEAGDALEEIVVTATKRTENVQNVPIAITAVTAEILEKKGITDVAKLANLAPNVQLDAGTPFSGSDTVLAAYIRGIGQNDFAFNQDPGVGVYVDGVYLARSVGSNISMLDVARVEILKGPQGTLFGRNTIGGAISVVTRDPGADFMFKGNITSGSFNRMDIQATADLPISDKVRSSLSFSSAKRDGFQRRVPFTDLSNGSILPPPAGFVVPPGHVVNEYLTLGQNLDCGAPGATCNFVTDDSSRFPAADHQTNTNEGGVNQWTARGKLVFLPSDAVKFTVSADYMSVDQAASANTATQIVVNQVNPVTNEAVLPNGTLGALYNLCLTGFVPVGVCLEPRGGLSPTPAPMPVLPPLFGVNADGTTANDMMPYDSRFETGNIDTSYATGNSFSKLNNWGVAATLEWALGGGANLKSITAYRDLHWKSGMDLDGSPLPILEPSFDMPQHEFSEELQVNGKAVDERFSYSVGAYYFKEAGHLHDYVIFPGGLLMIDGPNDLDTKAQALYAHLNFKITDKFGATAGARYTKETKHFEGFQHDDNGLSYKASGCNPPDAPSTLIGGPPTLTCQALLGFPDAADPYRYYPPGVRTQDFTNTSPTFGFDYHFSDDMMLYASYSKGYKTGSWTTRLSSPHPTYDDSLHFDPEHATSEELGLKSELLDRKLRLNLAGFYTKYENIQLNSQIGISPTLLNAGDANIYGAEAEAEAVLGSGFSFNAAIGYTHAEYTRIAPGVGDNGIIVDKTFKLPKTPEFKFYAGPQYTANLAGGGALTFNADWTHTSELFNDLGNTQALKRDSTDLVNASITYAAPEDKWEFVVGGTNLSDDRYIVSGQWQGGVSVVDASYNRPREWFATIRVNMK
jgi:iron complex outermembrane recepter protein